MAIQDKFSSKNVIYKITSDVDLEGGTLTVPAGCTLDFQGGSINNGTVRGNGAYVSGETSGCSAKFEDVVYFTSGQETALNGMVVEINNRMVEVEDRFNDSLDDMNLKINYIDNKVAKANSTASKAEAKADSAISTSNEAANTATIAKNAVATLEGLADADEAQQTLAAQVVQIEENKQNIALNKAETDEKLTELGSEVNHNFGNDVVYNIPNDSIGGDSVLAFSFACKSGSKLTLSHKINSRISVYPINKQGQYLTTITLIDNKPVEYTTTEDIVGFAFWRQTPVDGDSIYVSLGGEIDEKFKSVNDKIIANEVSIKKVSDHVNDDFQKKGIFITDYNKVGDSVLSIPFTAKKGEKLYISQKASTQTSLYPHNKNGFIEGIILKINGSLVWEATEDILGFGFWRDTTDEDTITISVDGSRIIQLNNDIKKTNDKIDNEIDFTSHEIAVKKSIEIDNEKIGDSILSIPFEAKKGSKIHFSHSSPNANALYPHNKNGVIGGIIIKLNHSEVIWEATEDIIGFGFWRQETDVDIVDIRINGDISEKLYEVSEQVRIELGKSISIDIDYNKMGDSILSIPFEAKKGDKIHFTHTSPNINNLYPHNKHGFISGIIIYLRDGETTWTATEDIIGFAFLRQAVDSDTINIFIKGEIDDKVKEAIETFGVSGSTKILDLHPDKYMIPLLANYKWNGEVTATEFGHEPLVLMHFSDIHGDADRLKRIVEFKEHYSEYIDDAIHTGDATEIYFDYYNGSYTLDDKSFAWWANSGANSILNIMGDHDSMGGSPSLSGGIKGGGSLAYSQKKVCSRFITPFESEWGLTNHPSNATYWYKDYTNCGVRLVALDNIHYRETLQLADGGTTNVYPLDNEPTDNGEQLAWFVETLADAKNQGLSVIVATHSPYKQDPIQCTFMSLDGRYYNSVNLPLELVQAVQSFIDNGGKFVSWITGELHVDVFANVQGYPKQLLISIDTATGVRENGQMWSFNNKPDNTLAMDCFNLVSVDVDKGYIRLHRIGSMYDRQGREIVGLVYDYVNQTLIYNS